MLILEKKLKQNFIKTYCNICQMGYKNFLIEHKLKLHNFLLFLSLSKVIQTVFFSSIEKISLSFIVLTSTEFVKFMVREIKD